jgi:hypothetical protein
MQVSGPLSDIVCPFSSRFLPRYLRLRKYNQRKKRKAEEKQREKS